MAQAFNAMLSSQQQPGLGMLGSSPVGPFDFINRYHQETINQSRALRNADGSITTVYAVGIPYEGKIYTLPGYDREAGRKMSEDEARDFWVGRIPGLVESGQIVGIDEAWEGSMETHPANAGARENHLLMEQMQVPESAIGFDLFRRDRE